MDRPRLRATLLGHVGPRGDRRAGREARHLLLIASLLAACIPVGDDGADPSEMLPSEFPARVLEVIDGDSLRVESNGTAIEIRLAGINAPEADECHGDVAALGLADLVGEEVAFVQTDEDQFGRVVAYVWSSDGFVNSSMARAGDALALADGGDRAPDIDDSARSARAADLGMWAPDACGEVLPAGLSVELTEPDPRGPDDEVLDDEYVTIRNDGTAAIDLSGWILRDESTANRLVLPAATRLVPGSVLIVHSGCPSPPEVGWCAGSPIWNNGGDSVLLLGPAGTVAAFDTFRP